MGHSSRDGINLTPFAARKMSDGRWTASLECRPRKIFEGDGRPDSCRRDNWSNGLEAFVKERTNQFLHFHKRDLKLK